MCLTGFFCLTPQPSSGCSPGQRPCESWPEAVQILARGRARGILPGPKPSEPQVGVLTRVLARASLLIMSEPRHAIVSERCFRRSALPPSRAGGQLAVPSQGDPARARPRVSAWKGRAPQRWSQPRRPATVVQRTELRPAKSDRGRRWRNRTGKNPLAVGSGAQSKTSLEPQ